MTGITEQELEQAAREKKAEYYRNWRKKNPAAVKKHQDTYWKKKVLEELKEQK